MAPALPDPEPGLCRRTLAGTGYRRANQAQRHHQRPRHRHYQRGYGASYLPDGSRGYTFNPHTGEIEELAGFVEDFSKRNAQINTRTKELIALWEKGHPGQSIGVDLMNRIDHQAWADTRSDKTSENSANFEKWATELADLGFVAPTPSNRSTRFNSLRNADSVSPRFYEEAATQVLAVLSEQKSGWSVADIKAQALTYCAENNVIAQAAGLEDITGRIVDVTLSRCLLINPDIDPYRAPTHLPLLTSQQVVATESNLFDYTSALVARGTSYELSYSPLAELLKLGAHQSVGVIGRKVCPTPGASPTTTTPTTPHQTHPATHRACQVISV